MFYNRRPKGTVIFIIAIGLLLFFALKTDALALPGNNGRIDSHIAELLAQDEKSTGNSPETNPDELSELYKKYKKAVREGGLYRSEKRYQKSLAAYNEALKICQKLKEKKPGVYLKDWAETLNKKATLYLENPDDESNESIRLALDTFNEALDVYKKLENQDAHRGKIAKVYNHIAGCHIKKRKYGEASAAYKKALLLERILADEEPNKYLPFVALTLNNLALLDKETKRYKEALAKFKKALGIYRGLKKRLKNENPDENLFNMSKALANLGSCYRDYNNQFKEAGKAYKEALGIRKRLAKKDRRKYELAEGKILFLMSYLCLRKAEADINNAESYKRDGLPLVIRAITLYEKYVGQPGVDGILRDANKLKTYFEE
jgi:tetratricopeptide (TPR) repeat protein